MTKPTTPRKPTFKKYPPCPKASATVEVWKKYKERVSIVKRENVAKLADYTAKVKAVAAYKSSIEKLKKEALAIKNGTRKVTPRRKPEAKKPVVGKAVKKTVAKKATSKMKVTKGGRRKAA